MKYDRNLTRVLNSPCGKTNDFDFIHKEHFCKNKKFNFSAKIYEIRKKCRKIKLFIFKKSKNLIFSYELYLLFIDEKRYEKKTLDFQKAIRDTKKNVGDKIVHLKKIYKFTSDHFLIGHFGFRFNRKNVKIFTNLLLTIFPYELYLFFINEKYN